MKARKRHDRSTDLKKQIAQEKLILDVTEAVFEQLEIQGKSKADLAKLMGRSNAYITQLLNGSRNMTLRTLSDIGFALNIQPRFEVGFRDQLCQEPNWDTFVRSEVRPARKVVYHSLPADERNLSGEWVDACVNNRAA
jgi:transcriptional regulator with XRE-family HTH domain